MQPSWTMRGTRRRTDWRRYGAACVRVGYASGDEMSDALAPCVRIDHNFAGLSDEVCMYYFQRGDSKGHIGPCISKRVACSQEDRSGSPACICGLWRAGGDANQLCFAQGVSPRFWQDVGKFIGPSDNGRPALSLGVRLWVRRLGRQAGH